MMADMKADMKAVAKGCLPTVEKLLAPSMTVSHILRRFCIHVKQLVCDMKS